jgi:asparagine synthase (glutamine-hydrolysing)
VSGIFGIVSRGGRPVDSADLERMRSAMAHRGPDGSDIWSDGAVGLGQLMLCTTPESLHEKLPWEDAESGLVITADARIDNRDELLSKLGGSPSRLKPLPQEAQASVCVGAASAAIPDSLLILEAYKRWGESCAEHLLGDFAFAIWNPRERRLFCARDPMGLRPFHYYVDDRLFVFGSSALGVVAADAVPRRLSETRIADHLFWELEGVDKTCTFFEGVLRMPPAHTAVLEGRELRLREYWRPDPGSELKLGSEQEYTDAFEEVLTQSVAARLRCHKPAASMLSGGLDSSTIVGVACKLRREEAGEPFATYSGVSENAESCRESRYARKVIDHGEQDAHLLRPSDVPRLAERLHAVDERIEDPFEAGWILAKMIYVSARERGQVVVMDGIGGESTTTLPSSYPVMLARRGNWRLANREIVGMWNHYHRRTIPLWWKYRDLARATLVPGFARRLKRRLRPSRRDWIEADYLISRNYAQRAGLRGRLEAYRNRKSYADCVDLRQAHVRQLGMSYLTAGTERYGRLAAACGVENRQPLQDRRLVEFCVSLPWNQLVRDGWSKFGLRRVAERVLPRDVAWRTGWDEVMWKFWAAWYRLDKPGGTIELAADPPRLQHMLDIEKFRRRSRRYMIDSDLCDEGIINYLSLVRWLKHIE